MLAVYFLVCLSPYVACLSHDVMKAQTGFISLTCDTVSDAYVYTVMNGYVLPLDATVILTCEGASVVSSDFTISARAQSDQRSIAPTGASVKNRVCTIALTGTDPITSSETTFQSIDSTCGAIIRDGDDGSATCDYPDFPCMFDSGDWYHNTFSWFMIDVFYIVIMAVIYGVMLLINYTVSRRKFVNQTQYKNSVANSKSVVSIYNVAPPALDENGLPRAGMTTMSTDERLRLIRSAHADGNAKMGSALFRQSGGKSMSATPNYKTTVRSSPGLTGWIRDFFFGKNVVYEKDYDDDSDDEQMSFKPISGGGSASMVSQPSEVPKQDMAYGGTMLPTPAVLPNSSLSKRSVMFKRPPAPKEMVSNGEGEPISKGFISMSDIRNQVNQELHGHVV